MLLVLPLLVALSANVLNANTLNANDVNADRYAVIGSSTEVKVEHGNFFAYGNGFIPITSYTQA